MRHMPLAPSGPPSASTWFGRRSPRASGSPLRLCHVTATLAGGGLEERIARITRALDPLQFQTSWVGLGPAENNLPSRVGGLARIVSVPRARPGVEANLVLRLAARLAPLEPDVVHVHNWSASLYGILAARLAGAKVVIYGEGGRDDPGAPSPRRRALMRGLAPHVDHFTSVCDFLGAELRRDWNVPAQRVSTVRTGVDRPPMALDRAALRARFGLRPDAQVVVVSAGRFRAVKQLEALVTRFAKLAPHHPRAVLLLLGDALERRRALMAAAGGPAPWLCMPGHQPDVACLLPGCDIAVNASTFEGASNGVLEAMAAGLPVVATAVGGTPELVIDGWTGRLIPPTPGPEWEVALRTLLNDPDLARAWGQAGQARALTEFSNAQMVSAYADLYQSLRHRTVPSVLPRGLWDCAKSAVALAG